MKLYGLNWPTEDRMRIEITCLRKGGKWKQAGRWFGEGDVHHRKCLMALIAPEFVWHKWAHLLVEEFEQNKITGILGPASSGKTATSGLWALSRYITWPECTTVLVSSTSREMLQLRVWGEIKAYHKAAVERNQSFSGHPIDSRLMITTDGKEVEGRDFRNGIVGVACLTGGNFKGLGNYIGIKNKNVVLVADELQLMPREFVNAINNLDSNRNFKCVGMGNPKDPTDALGILCEPTDGWDAMVDSHKTTTWNGRMPGARVVQLHGEDSPNMVALSEEFEPYPFLIGRRKLREAEAYYGKDSLQYAMMNAGVMPKNSSARRVITKNLCERHHAKDEPIWDNASSITKIGCADIAYSSIGGDRTVFMEMQFGLMGGIWVVAPIGSPTVVPVVQSEVPQEDQVAEWIKSRCAGAGIIAQHFFFDGTGRSTFTSAISRIWSPYVVPLEFGGKATDRPLGPLPMASSKYRKLVSEYWFATRFAIEAGQVRGMTESIIEEGSMREWITVGKSGTTSEVFEDVEAKEKTKARMGRSPDIYDAFVTGLEGCRRLGFQITSKVITKGPGPNPGAYAKYAEKYQNLIRSKQLVAA